jgi:hypothetical protein
MLDLLLMPNFIESSVGLDTADKRRLLDQWHIFEINRLRYIGSSKLCNYTCNQHDLPGMITDNVQQSSIRDGGDEPVPRQDNI